MKRDIETAKLVALLSAVLAASCAAKSERKPIDASTPGTQPVADHDDAEVANAEPAQETYADTASLADAGELGTPPSDADAPKSVNDAGTVEGGGARFGSIAPSALAQLGYPTADDGDFIVSWAPGLELRVEANPARNPLLTLALCTALLRDCYDQSEAMDSCFASVRQCATSRPWEEPTTCCPPQCRTQYLDERSSGRGELDAFVSVFGGETPASCIPGLAAFAAGETP